MNIRMHIPLFGFVSAIIFLQILASITASSYLLIQLTMTAYYVIVVLGLCMLMGYAGQVSLGHAAFFALGGYLTAIFSTHQLWELLSPQKRAALNTIGVLTSYNSQGDLHLSPIICFMLVILTTLIIALVIGIPLLRLKGHYLSMATLGFGIILHRIFLGTKIFGEADGIANVPPFHISSFLSIGGESSHRLENYYFAWFLVLLLIIFLRNIINSRVGRALRAIHDSEEAASAMGINTGRYKLIIFILSAIVASIGGFFMTHYNAGIGPSEAGIMKSVRYVAIVAVGGMANLWGCLIMGTVLNFLSLRGYFGSYDDAIFGILLIAIMLWAPEGIFNKEFFIKLSQNVKKLRWRFLK